MTPIFYRHADEMTLCQALCDAGLCSMQEGEMCFNQTGSNLKQYADITTQPTYDEDGEELTPAVIEHYSNYYWVMFQSVTEEQAAAMADYSPTEGEATPNIIWA